MKFRKPHLTEAVPEFSRNDPKDDFFFYVYTPKKLKALKDKCIEALSNVPHY